MLLFLSLTRTELTAILSGVSAVKLKVRYYTHSLRDLACAASPVPFAEGVRKGEH